MRDSGKEDVRAYSCAREGSLLWRKGEQRPGRKGKSIQGHRSSQKAAWEQGGAGEGQV